MAFRILRTGETQAEYVFEAEMDADGLLIRQVGNPPFDITILWPTEDLKDLMEFIREEVVRCGIGELKRMVGEHDAGLS